MAPLVIICFIVGYLLIVFEHPLRMDKTIPALLMGMLCWAIIAIGQLHLAGEAEVGEHGVNDVILHHLGKIAEILIFLIGAMTIVELVDLHKGFSVITNRIHTRDKRKLLWIVSWLAFFMSAILDNLTTTIVFVSLLRKLMVYILCSHSRQCWRSLDAYWRCDDDHALDCWKSKHAEFD